MTTSELELSLDGRTDRARRDRIRNWTRLGLLPTIGEKSPGTGRSLNYSAKSVHMLKVLEELAPLRIDFAGRRHFIEKIVADQRLFDAVRLLRQAVSA